MKQFDYVVIDEASQTVEPIMIESLKFAKKFVMIGDYLQLSPIISSDKAKKLGMDISLFERLCEANDNAVSY